MNLIKFKKYYKEYVVEDIVCEETNHYVFILESPYEKEIEKGYALAGNSGKTMSKFMGLDKDKPFGEYVSQKLIKGQNISILNISRSPLQKVKKLRKEYENLINDVGKNIKNGYKYFKNHSLKNKYLNSIEDFIVSDFQTRANKLKTNNNTKFIICGDFAEVYFNNVVLKNVDENNIIYVPHPSMNHWKENDANNKCLNLRLNLKDIFKQQ